MQKGSFEQKTHKVKRICLGKEEVGEDRKTLEQMQRERNDHDILYGVPEKQKIGLTEERN